MLYVATSALYPGATAQTLAQLEAQDDSDFVTILIDPGFDAEVAGLLAKTTLKQVIRLPYKVAPGPRLFDWAQWNSAFLLPDSDDDYVFRFQSNRLLPKNGIKAIKRKGCNVYFERHSVSLSPVVQDAYTQTVVGYKESRDSARNLDGAYGDWCLRVGDFLTVNGIDECLTMLNHCEDTDFELRWRIATAHGLMQQTARLSDFYLYLDPSCRRTRHNHYSVRDSFREPCPLCMANWPAYTLSNDADVRIEDLAGDYHDLGVQWGKRWAQCCLCGAILPQLGSPHFTINHQRDEMCAPAGILGNYGRDLRYARRQALALPMPERIQFVADSYWDRDVTMDHAPYRGRSMFTPQRWALLEDALRVLPDGMLMEIGAHRCGIAGYLAQRYPQRHVWAFDRFERGLSELGPHDMQTSASYHEGVQGSSYEDARYWATPWSNLILIPGDVRQTLPAGDGQPVALAIVDLNLYEPTKAAFAWLSERLAPGGVVLIDDPDFPGVKAALAEWGRPFEVRQGMAVARG